MVRKLHAAYVGGDHSRSTASEARYTVVALGDTRDIIDDTGGQDAQALVYVVIKKLGFLALR